MKATRANDTEVVSFLLDKGADPEVKDRVIELRFPLIPACRC